VHFALGMTAAWAFVRVTQLRSDQRLRPSVAPLASAALVGLTAVAYLVGHAMAFDPSGSLIWQRNLLYRAALFAALILAMALASRRAQWLMTNRVSRALGRLSYGIYLSHMPLIFLLVRTLKIPRTPLGLLTLTACVIPLSIGVGILSFLLIEQPARSWARRFRKPLGKHTASPMLRPLPIGLESTSAQRPFRIAYNAGKQ
jgi:peptidoglycan/LPS O-acetylase OafA/YrhL